MLEVAARIASTSFAPGGGLSPPSQPADMRRAYAKSPARTVRLTTMLLRPPLDYGRATARGGRTAAPKSSGGGRRRLRRASRLVLLSLVLPERRLLVNVPQTARGIVVEQELVRDLARVRRTVLGIHLPGDDLAERLPRARGRVAEFPLGVLGLTDIHPERAREEFLAGQPERRIDGDPRLGDSIARPCPLLVGPLRSVVVVERYRNDERVELVEQSLQHLDPVVPRGGPLELLRAEHVLRLDHREERLADPAGAQEDLVRGAGQNQRQVLDVIGQLRLVGVGG